MNTSRILSLAAAAALTAASALATDTLATWPLANTLSGNTSFGEALTVGDITAGSEVTSLSLSGKGYSGQGWTGASRNEKTYFQFTVTATEDYALDLDELAVNFRSTTTGPAKAEIRYSVDNGANWKSAGTNNVPQDGNDKGHPFKANFGTASVGAGQTLLVRIHAWGASAKSGTFRIGNTYSMDLSGTAVGTKQAPTIVFPHPAESVAVSNKLTVDITVLPAGSGLTKTWSFLPKPDSKSKYALSGKRFTYTPAAADQGKTFTLTVTATNGYGTTTGELPVTVTEFLPAGTWATGFETGDNPSYPSTATNVAIDGRTWTIQQLAFLDSAAIPKVGGRACVFGSYNEAYMVSADKVLDAAHGFGIVSFLYAEYPGESAPCQPLVVEVTTDLAGGDWMELGRVNPNGAETLTRADFPLETSEPVYLRIRTEYVNGSGRVVIDQLSVTPYVAPVWNDFERYLLQYNVTPGDPGCASQNFWAEGETTNSYLIDDFDEDGYSNWAEFTNRPSQTNPYDKTSHP